MTDDEIIEVLQKSRDKLSPVALADLLDELTEGTLSQGALVTYFKRAFPNIPVEFITAIVQRVRTELVRFLLNHRTVTVKAALLVVREHRVYTRHFEVL